MKLAIKNNVFDTAEIESVSEVDSRALNNSRKSIYFFRVTIARPSTSAPCILEFGYYDSSEADKVRKNLLTAWNQAECITNIEQL